MGWHSFAADVQWLLVAIATAMLGMLGQQTVQPSSVADLQGFDVDCRGLRKRHLAQVHQRC